MRKQIRVNFVDFWPDFVIEESRFYKLLKDRYDVIITDNPEYLFFSVFGSKHLEYDCVTIFYTGEDQVPDFNIADYAIGFAKLSFGDRYFRMPIFYLYDSDYQRMINKINFSEDDLHSKTGFCSFVYSNKKVSDLRKHIFERLSRYKFVSSGGHYLNNIGEPVADKWLFQKNHKFSIAFENYKSEGYTTEKLVQSFASQTVPVYWGDPTVKEVFNSDSFINVDDFNNLDEVVNEVKRIDNDDELYLKMMRTPALLHPEVDGQERVFENLSFFLFNIFDQDIEIAQRCNRGSRGRFYKAELVRRETALRHSIRFQLCKLYDSITGNK